MIVLKKYFMLFFAYSFLGWLMEVIWTLIIDKKIVNRGFLIGPYCPIYGFGCLLLSSLLSRYKSNVILLFIMSIVICSILEYFTSFLMEKLFNARWWDYSKYKFNLNGRICAETMIPFGVLGVLVIYYLNPFLIKNINTNSIIFMIMVVLFIVDFFVSFGIITNLRSTISVVAKDSTEEITRRVMEVIRNKSFLHRRLINAFPSFKSSIDKIKKIINQ